MSSNCLMKTTKPLCINPSQHLQTSPVCLLLPGTSGWSLKSLIVINGGVTHKKIPETAVKAF